MPIYKYRAKKGPEETIEGTLEAQSEKEAIEKVSQLGYTPLRLSLGVGTKEPTGGPLFWRQGKIKSREITIFSRQLASLLKSGVPILSSLTIILEQSENPALKKLLTEIHQTVKSGTTFSESLTNFPHVFGPLYIAMIRTGEDSGVLPEVLLRIADYRLKQEEALSRFRMALAYPLLMALVGAGTILFMLTFVMPRLMKLFINMGQDLPLPTRILIALSQALCHWWLWAGIALFVLVAKKQLKGESAKLYSSKMKLRLPFFGMFILKHEMCRFCRTLELLIKSGIPILRAIRVAIPVVGNEILKKQLAASSSELEQGGSFGKSLKNSGFFPPFMSNLIIVGEESGKLTDALGEVALSYERDTDEATRVMTSLLEPSMILVMGGIVGFIVVAMLLPIFQINLMTR